MDLIYTNPKFVDQGVLHDYELDLAYGSGENDFLLTKDISDPQRIKAESLVYAEDTDYGGMVDWLIADTTSESSKVMQYRGRTWHGLLNSRIVQPDPGADYYNISGEANTCLGTVIDRLGWSTLFAASGEDSGITIKPYQFARYIKGYDGIASMLEAAGAKLIIRWGGSRAVLSAVPVVDYANEEFDSDRNAFKVSKLYRPVNHLICLGKGDLAERIVIHLYADEKGTVSLTQTITGTKLREETYDYSNAEYDDLLADGEKKLKELQDQDSCEVVVEPSREYDIGDIAAARNEDAGIAITAKITKKIINLTETLTTIDYEVGAVSSSVNFQETSK